MLFLLASTILRPVVNRPHPNLFTHPADADVHMLIDKHKTRLLQIQWCEKTWNTPCLQLKTKNTPQDRIMTLCCGFRNMFILTSLTNYSIYYQNQNDKNMFLEVIPLHFEVNVLLERLGTKLMFTKESKQKSRKAWMLFLWLNL